MKIHLLCEDWYLCFLKEGKCTELTKSSEGTHWLNFPEAGCKTSPKSALNIWEALPWPALVSESILKHPYGYL